MTTLTTAAATSAALSWTAGPGVAAAQGTFGGGNLTVEASFDAGGNWIALADETGTPVALTAEGTISFRMPTCSLRAVLAGSTGATVDFAILPS